MKKKQCKRKTNRETKDRLFKKLFGSAENKANMLSLYNALNVTDYSDVSCLELYTIDDAVFLGMRNDVGYILDSYICLHEQQSTYNPNMPIRGLLYHAKMYEKYITQHDIDIHTSTLKKIPTPQFYVFYNGDRITEDRFELKLSEAFVHPAKEGTFEWTAIMLNINKGHNTELLLKCDTLNGYATFIEKIKELKNSGFALEQAIIQAVDWCIDNQILGKRAGILGSSSAEMKAT